jgi:hypothetical protein
MQKGSIFNFQRQPISAPNPLKINPIYNASLEAINTARLRYAKQPPRSPKK